MLIINTTCPFCHKTTAIKVRRASDYHTWKNGVPAQDAFPYLSADEREMLISGICPDCWNKMFGEEEDEEECFEPGRPIIDIFALNP